MLKSFILKIPANIRNAIYTASKLAALALTFVAGTHLIDPTLGSGLGNVLAWIGAAFAPIAAAGPIVAGTVLRHQEANNTLSYSGTDANQAIAAAQSVAQRAATSASELEHVRQAINDALAGNVPAAMSDAVTVATDTVGEVVTACGDALK
jgi:hypothetical protein